MSDLVYWLFSSSSDEKTNFNTFCVDYLKKQVAQSTEKVNLLNAEIEKLRNLQLSNMKLISQSLLVSSYVAYQNSITNDLEYDIKNIMKTQNDNISRKRCELLHHNDLITLYNSMLELVTKKT